MSVPSLKARGAIKPGKYIDPEDAKDISNMRAIDYIIKFIDRRTTSRGSPIKIKPTTMGDKIILLRSGTGSGKSTIIAPELYKNFLHKVGRNIIITQPRILTAIDKAQDMSRFYPNLIMGYNIGYQTGGRTYKPREKGITSMTTGILLNILTTMKSINFAKKYSFVIIDEIHEKDINTDTILFLIKKFLKDYWELPDCPIFIFMSATFSPDAYRKYFQIPPANFIEAEGRTFPIIEHFPKYDIRNYITYVINLATQLHVKNISDIQSRSRDIIIFVKNRGDAVSIVDALHVFNATVLDKGMEYARGYVSDKSKKGGAAAHYVIPIMLNKHSFTEGGVDYRNLFSDIQYLQVPIYGMNDLGSARTDKVTKWVSPSRKIIVTTPIAETGITIESLKYCIDTGWVLSPEFNPDFGVTILLNKNISKAMVHQRKGRVGRTAVGEWYPCYTKETFSLLPEDFETKYITENISEVLLNIIVNETQAYCEEVKIEDYPDADREDMFRKHEMRPVWNKMTYGKELDVSSLDFFTPPSASGICYSLEKLHVLGLIDFNYHPTILGYLINQMRKLELEPVRMIFAGYSHGANILDLITIAAFLQVERRNICGRRYTLRNPADLEGDSARFYNRVFIADEFIDSVFLWNEFMREVSQIEAMINEKNQVSISHIKKWCHKTDVDYDNMLRVVSVRDEIIESLIVLGIDPYYNGLNLDHGTYNLAEIFKQNLDDGVAEIKKIKRCIVDGYRCNVARWNPAANSYEMDHRHAKIKVRSSLVSEIATEQQRPQVIVLSGTVLQADFGTVNYSFNSSGSVCVLDGFVDLDMQFLQK